MEDLSVINNLPLSVFLQLKTLLSTYYFCTSQQPIRQILLNMILVQVSNLAHNLGNKGLGKGLGITA